MKTPYLIQRGKIENRDWKTGIDSIIRYDYMGSAEFEFGALSDSLHAIREVISEYALIDIPFKNKIITIFCQASDKPEMEEFLEKLYKKEYHLKEWSAFPEVVNGGDSFYTDRVNFWWDIDNNFMFWIKNNEFEIKFKEKIEPKD